MDLGTRIAIGSIPFTIGISLIIACAFYEGHRIHKRRLRSFDLAGFVLSAIGLVLMATLPKEQRPEITLKVVYPSQPHLEVINTSNVVAQAVTYSPVIWNIDHPDENNPLPLPRPKIDYIPAHAAVGPYNVFQAVGGNLKQGTRLFGTISVECSLCNPLHVYWVYVVWGEDGWYSEIPKSLVGSAATFPDNKNPNIAEFAARNIATIPENKRVPFSNDM